MSVWDSKTGRHYLIDTGADESVFPAPPPTDRQHCSTTQPLAAANDSRTATWGQRNIIVHLGSRCFTQSFHIADERQPILGADFLVSNNLASTSADVASSIFSLFSHSATPSTKDPVQLMLLQMVCPGRHGHGRWMATMNNSLTLQQPSTNPLSFVLEGVTKIIRCFNQFTDFL